MSTEKKKPLNRDQALNDATSGQFGEEPRPHPKPGTSGYGDRSSSDSDIERPESRRRAARRMSRDI